MSLTKAGMTRRQQSPTLRLIRLRRSLCLAGAGVLTPPLFFNPFRARVFWPCKTLGRGAGESFNRRLSDEWLNAHWFLSITDAQAKIEAWRPDYSESRPHTSLGWMTPVEYAAAAAKAVE
ncbi:MAG: transposase [Cytophagaceae bacterium]|nr:MAG: transposase [Cytophagaceae bacterium]